MFDTILFKWLGWRERVTVTPPRKCILCVAPHTSNWDFIIGKLYYWAKGEKAQFLMKKEWFAGPLGPLFRKMGGIPVERSRSVSLTDQLAARANKSADFRLAVTPEGTRSLAPVWKRGFYYIALKAGIPIVLYAIDYKNREIVCTKIIRPSGAVDDDMREIMEYYRPFNGRHPGKFAVEEIPGKPSGAISEK